MFKATFTARIPPAAVLGGTSETAWQLRLPLPNITMSTWAFGYHNQMNAITFMPFGFAGIKTLVSGTTAWFILEPASLSAALCSKFGVDHVSFDYVKDTIGNANAALIKELKEQGLKCWFCSLEANQSIYIPNGFVLVEWSVKGRLLYGVENNCV